MKYYLPAAVGLSAVLITGIVHGFWTDRWVVSEELSACVARLEKIPLDLGEWQGQEVERVPPASGGAAGHLVRRYVHQQNGTVVTVAIVCGRPGPVAVHTPDVCYGASGYDVGAPHRVTVPANKGEFWTADAVKGSATGDTKLRIYWSWNDGSGWVASDNARQTFPR